MNLTTKSSLLAVLLVLWRAELVSSSCLGPISALEYESLSDFFTNNNGINWNCDALPPVGSPWQLEPVNYSAPCSVPWMGVSCSVSESGAGCYVTGLALAYCGVSGQLPSTISGLSHITLLDLSVNFLTGSIPIELLQLSTLRQLDFGFNAFTSFPPEILYALPNLAYLKLSVNHLTGQVLDTTHEIKIEELYLNSNHFSGTLNPAIGLRTCMSLYLNDNKFHGPLFEDIGMLADTTGGVALAIQDNKFTGTIPVNLANGKLVALSISNNRFSGPFSRLTNNPQLFTILAENNLFTGSLNEWAKSSVISYFFLDDNLLTGSIPAVWATEQLRYLHVGNNYLTGSVPNQLTDSAILGGLNLQHNYLTGTIPSEVCLASNLDELLLSDNSLTSTLPPCLSLMFLLVQFQVSNNELVGSLDTLFPTVTGLTYFQDLISFHADRNRFTGTIPSEIFRAKHIQSVSLASNCLRGSLPSSICAAAELQQLVLDGLSGNPWCQAYVSPSLRSVLHASFAQHLMTGSLLPCLFQLEKLSLLHIAGNGLRGHLEELPLSTNLTNISLANNQLTGTIPLSWQEVGWRFQQLDLAVNRLSGALVSGFQVNASATYLNLSINRLSGNLPSSFRKARNINVLDGNVFQCNEYNKPESDPNANGYVCGSRSFDSMLILWGVLTGLIILLISTGFGGYLWNSEITNSKWCWRKVVYRLNRCSRFTIGKCQDWLETIDGVTSNKSECSETSQFLQFLRNGILMSIICTLAIVLILLPSYLLLKLIPSFASEYSTHSYQYTWVTTMTYLHGIPPMAIGVSTILLLLTLALPMLKEKRRSIDHLSRDTNLIKSTRSASWLNWLTTLTLIALIQLINALVMLTVNGAYVTAVLTNVPNLVYLQIALSVFKMAWAMVYIPASIRLIGKRCCVETRTLNELFLRIFNLLLAPVIASALTDSNCFLNLFVPQTSIVTHYLETITIYLPIATSPDVTTEVSFEMNPPWLYSYQCSSSTLVNYTPVLLSLFTLSSCVVPPIMLALALLPASMIRKNWILRSAMRRFDILWLDGLIVSDYAPVGIVPVPLKDDNANGSNGESFSLSCPSPFAVMPASGSSGDSSVYLSSEIQPSSEVLLPPSETEVVRPLFSSHRMACILLQHLTILLTYGAASPFVGIAILMTVLVETFLWKMFLGRAIDSALCSVVYNDDDTMDGLTNANELTVGSTITARLEATLNDAWKAPTICFLMITWIVAAFWSMGTFDMIADVYGNTAGIISTVSVAGAFVVIPLVFPYAWNLGN